jgi:hypothetical protein
LAQEYADLINNIAHHRVRHSDHWLQLTPARAS